MVFQLTLHHEIKKPADEVFLCLTEMSKFTEVHPVIYKIEELGIDDSGSARYLIYEKLKLGFMPCSFTYTAKVEYNCESQRVWMSASIRKLVHIKMQFVLEAQAEKTLVLETLDFESCLPLRPILEKTFRTQHRQLFLNIEKFQI